ncbi:MAG: S41 family peptidase, partial [Acidobacteria bacterium]|nr:S41 family peptidase [Acidobacteriota bacterium]
PQRLLGFGERNPIFTLPTGFVRRLGTQNSHFHFSGTYQSGGKRIGYLRFPDFDPPSFGAYTELANEIAFMKANTDGLVIDITRNAGGVCYGQDALQYVIPKTFRGATDEIRPSLSDLQYYEYLKSNPFRDLEPWQINLLNSTYQQLAQAYSENRGRTGPLPVCSESIDVEPLRNRDGSLTAYDKPILLLTDEFTISWGDTFAQIFSDAKRGPLFGLRTNGAGGSVLWGEGGPYTEGSLSYTTSLGVRAAPVAAPGYPLTAYYENVGIHPDIPYDIMTEENLRNGYRPYVEAFTQAILAEINKAVN